MGNLYRLNSLFELEITKPIQFLNENKSLLERSTVYEYLFFAISRKDDFTILSEPASKELLEYWKENKIEFGNNVITNNPYYAERLELNEKIPKGLELIEWGKTSTFDNKKNVVIKKQAKINLSYSLNSKVSQTLWKESIGVNNLTSIICLDKNELDFCISKFSFPFIVKPEFGFSGRGNFIIKDTVELEKFYDKIPDMFLQNTNGIILEEWVGESKNLDFSGIFELALKRSNLLSITKMLVDKTGVYRGTIIEKNFGKELESGMKEIVFDYQKFSSSYKGSIAMDGFIFYRDGKKQIQYMSEINFRFSMGRILYELHQKIGNGIDNCGLFFFPIKNKTISFRAIVAHLETLKAKYKIDLLILTPLHNAKSKLNPFVGIYLNSSAEISLEIVDEIKKLFT